MSQNIHRLTDRAIRNATKPLADGGNLWVYPKGNARGWIFRFTLHGKTQKMDLGSFPAVSLAQARKLAAQQREILRSGIDPIDHRDREARAAALKAAGVPTFTQAAARYIRAHRSGWTNAKHARQWCATLKTYVRPIIGRTPVDSIGTEDVLRVLQPIWTTKTETAKRVQGRLENVLDFAAARQWRDQSNPARWRGHLDKLLPRPSRVATVDHHPAMPYGELPAFMVELEALDGCAALALRFLILTAARTAEVIYAEWSEIDLKEAVWTIPADRMKARGEHRVPLTQPALKVLLAVPRIARNPYVFPGTRNGRPMSEGALLKLMQRLGYGIRKDRGDYVPHGFRSTFRDWAGEVSSFPHDVCEMALDHAIANKVEAAYRRGDLFDKRRVMMAAWADWCGKGSGAKVLPIAPRRARQ